MPQTGEKVTIGAGIKKFRHKDDPNKIISTSDYSKLGREGALVNPAPKGTGQQSYELFSEYDEYTWNESSNSYQPTGGQVVQESSTHYSTMDQAKAAIVQGTSTDWGAANISKDMFVNTDGTPKNIEEIYTTLDPLLPGVTGDALKMQIKDMLPKYTGAPEEERGFAKEAYERDVYGISKEAGKVGAQMGQAYGGMGTSMRGAVGGMKDVSQQFEQAGQAYEEDIYGLEKRAGAEFESGIEQWLDPSWFETEGGVAQTSDFRQGGRVPYKEESFSEILSKLPEAGGS